MRFLILLALPMALLACGPASTPGEGLLAAHRGQWLVINYWAIWCKPCIQEIPELNALAAIEGVSVLGVNFDGATGEELAAQVADLGIDFPTLDEDPAAMLGVARPRALPTTLIIDPQGTLREPLVGPQTLASLTAATEQPLPAGHGN